jgi:glycosyltransferase involved in cell wall biosynthesis
VKGFSPGSRLVIAVDTFMLSNECRNSGTYVYGRNLLREFAKILREEDQVTIRPFVASHGKDRIGASTSRVVEPISTSGMRHRRWWRLGGATLEALRAHADLLFSPSAHVMPLGIVPVVATIHDVIPAVLPAELVPGSAILNAFTRAAAKFSRRILTDSEHSKKDLVEIFGVPPEKVTAVHLGYDRDVFNSKAPDPASLNNLLERFGIRQPYLIHHGTVHPRKNLVRLIHAYSLLLTRRPDLGMPLVLAGPLGWHHELIEAEAAKVPDGGIVIFTGTLPDADLSLLVKGAALCIIPSLYEGFCLPLVEAMACGIPTIASEASCIPEISGGCLRYFDPYDVEQISVVMQEVLEDSDLQSELSEKGVLQAHHFGWDRCARETLAELAGVAGRELVPKALDSACF